MDGKLSPGIGVLAMIVASTFFASNHLSARIAFDHGASVATAVSVRAAFTALVLLAVMRVQKLPLAVPRGLRAPAFFAGLLIAAQSYCIGSAVALIPPALALLVFQTSPALYVLISWAMGKEPPRWRAVAPMVLALAGLALALNLTQGFQYDGANIAVGVGWACASSVCMATVYYLNANALKPLDARVRTFAMTAVTALVMVTAGGLAGALALPRDGMGWLGLGLLPCFYCVAMMTLFYALPRVPSTIVVALNFEPVALFLLGWIILGHAMSPLQITGALLTVGAITWLGVAKK
jgi:drug/metabolite transporter (DMT)-like permease